MDYIANLVGTEHISLGLDNVYFPEILNLFYQRAGEATYPKNYVGTNVLDSFQPEKIDDLIEELLKRNYQSSAITGILGGNFVRVAEKVWK